MDTSAPEKPGRPMEKKMPKKKKESHFIMGSGRMLGKNPSGT